ncbi:hypothetical protein B0H14DRAFT_2629080 [Mycena olivaceomarginata]|nr:hypothetical protein B0H14DRAFT_2629080 [Mycena olivaceomarginata]
MIFSVSKHEEREEREGEKKDRHTKLVAFSLPHISFVSAHAAGVSERDKQTLLGLEVIGVKDCGLNAEGQAQGLEAKAIDLEDLTQIGLEEGTQTAIDPADASRTRREMPNSAGLSEPETFRCSHCRKYKEATDFGTKKNGSRAGTCRECQLRARDAARAKKTAEKENDPGEDAEEERYDGFDLTVLPLTDFWTPSCTKTIIWS